MFSSSDIFQTVNQCSFLPILVTFSTLQLVYGSFIISNIFTSILKLHTTCVLLIVETTQTEVKEQLLAFPRDLTTLHHVSKSCQERETAPLPSVSGSRVASNGKGKTCAVLCVVSETTGTTPRDLGSHIVYKAWFHVSDYTYSQQQQQQQQQQQKVCGHQKIHAQPTRNHYIPQILVCGVPFSQTQITGSIFFDHSVNTEGYLKIFDVFVNQMADDSTIGCFQKDGERCHTLNASKMENESFFLETELSQKTSGQLSPHI
jgi:hypothetical protein